MSDRRITTDKWRTYIIEGYVDENSDEINIGGLVFYDGEFYFDGFEFLVENEKGEFQNVPIENAGFEQKVQPSGIPGWYHGIKAGTTVNVKEFETITSKDSYTGRYSLLLKGTGTVLDTTNIIGPAPGFSPQIGTLVTMLNNMTSRVERAVEFLELEQVDWLLDEKANSIGALIKHLIATEIYYQNFTFEGLSLIHI